MPRSSRAQRRVFAVCLALQLVLRTQLAISQDKIPAHLQSVLDTISANSLRGHLSFIASDLLEGRDSPSRGLDIAAEYIAAQFRRAGLEPVGGDGYFQTANWRVAVQDPQAFRLQLVFGGRTLDVGPQQVSFRIGSAVEVSTSEVIKLEYQDLSNPSTLTATQVEKRVVLAEIPDFQREDVSRWEELAGRQQAFLRKLAELKAALVISLDRQSQTGSGAGNGRLIDPENRGSPNASAALPWIRVHSADGVRIYDGLQQGANPGKVSLSVPAPVERPVKLRNVVGLLRGSDPVLQDSYILVTAHYDHLGTDPSRETDSIFNGANDDSSGTVSVIELASALSRLNPRPKRSLVFMTVFAEEKGLLGSRFYARHPVFPLEKTVANINLEVLGRTDGPEGGYKNKAGLTGLEYSNLGEVFVKAGQLSGVEVYRHPTFSDAFFSRSDNLALAEKGVVAHSLCSGFVVPDYHAPQDHWDKIDYPNLAKLNRLVSIALWMIAENPEAPSWNAAIPKAAPYLKAWRERHQ
jgi:peptidase M28-like protein